MGDAEIMRLIVSLLVGVSLAAACGYRVFVPMLVMGLSFKAGMLGLADNWGWIGSWPAILAFTIATIVEVGAFYIPWLDNLLDAAAIPIAIIAGIVVTAACVTDVDPLLRWSLAIVAGGSAAGLTQTATTALRGASTLTTGGFANPIFATAELFVASILSVLAIVAPVLAILTLAGLLFVAYRLYHRLRRRGELNDATGALKA